MMLSDMQRMTRTWALTVMAVVLGSPVAFAQEDVKADVERMMAEVASGKPLTKSLRQIGSGGEAAVIDAAKAHLSAPVDRVRYHALMLVKQASQRSGDQALRRSGVKALVDALDDSKPLVWQHAAKGLMGFEADDFGNDAKASLQAMLRRPHPRREVARLVGLADLRDQMPRLRELLIDERTHETETSVGKWYGTVSWNARLALARMGDEAAIDWVAAMVRGEANDVIRVTVLLRDLGYVGKAKTQSLLIETLNSDDRLSSTKVGRSGMPVWQYAMDVLASTVEEFPVAAESPGSYSDDNRAAAQVWARTQAAGNGG